MDENTRAMNVLRQVPCLESATVVSTAYDAEGPIIVATLDNGDVWTIEPGLQYGLSVICPRGESFSVTSYAEGERNDD